LHAQHVTVAAYYVDDVALHIFRLNVHAARTQHTIISAAVNKIRYERSGVAVEADLETQATAVAGRRQQNGA
jgi:hypothetical protein